MKKCKKLILLLVATATLLLLATTAYADSANYAEVPTGTTKAQVSFTIEKVVAFEGTVSVGKNNGFKEITITPKVKTEKEDTHQWAPVTGRPDEKIVYVGGSVPATITITVDLESTSPMRSGIYYVTLNYGRTNVNGSYNANRSMKTAIYVGVSAPDEDDTESSSSKKENASEQEEKEDPEVTVTESSEGTGRTDLIGMLDLSALRSALEEAEKLKTSGRLDADELALLQDAIDVAEEALSSDRQGAIDDAAYELFAVIESLGGPVTDEELEPKKEKSGGGGLLLPLILALIAVLGIAGVLMYLRMKKKRRVQYEGAPIVDYEIGDDDLL